MYYIPFYMLILMGKMWQDVEKFKKFEYFGTAYYFHSEMLNSKAITERKYVKNMCWIIFL